VKTIALAAAKGGVGKTTLAAALATAAALDLVGLKVAVADLDPQGSLTDWWNTRALPHPAHADLAGHSIEAGQHKLRAAGLDVLILDCPPGYSTVLREAIAASDLVLVPTGASVLDLTAVTATAEMAKQEGVPFRFVLNRAVFRSRLAGQAVQTLRERGGLLWPPVHQRVPVAAAMAAGRTALETEPDGAAARELSALWHAVRANLEGLAPGRRSALTVARSRA
jgi:chromosome partitioning protein